MIIIQNLFKIKVFMILKHILIHIYILKFKILLFKVMENLIGKLVIIL